MSQALRPIELPAEAIALIQEGNPRVNPLAKSKVESVNDGTDKSESTVVIDVHERGDRLDEVVGSSEEPQPVLAAATKGRTNVLPSREPDTRPVPTGISSSMTVRLPPDLPTRLLRVTTERKIVRQPPWTQQEIVADALYQWLKQNGY